MLSVMMQVILACIVVDLNNHPVVGVSSVLPAVRVVVPGALVVLIVVVVQSVAVQGVQSGVVELVGVFE